MITASRIALIVSGCLLVTPLLAAEKAAAPKSAPSGQTVVTFGSNTLSRAELNQMADAQRQSPGGPPKSDQNIDLYLLYGWLRDEALLAAADEMKVQPNQQDIQKQEQNLRKHVTPEDWQKMQAASQFTLQAVDRYRAGLQQGGQNPTELRDTIWKELGGQKSGVPRSAFDQTLETAGRNDQAYQELKASIPQNLEDAIAKAREQFADASRIMQVQDRIAGNVQVTDEEVARAKQVIPAEGQQQMAKAPGGFKGALTMSKKQQAVDEWLRPRILSGAKFADKALERRFRAMLQSQQQPQGAQPQGQMQGQPQGAQQMQGQPQGMRQAPAGAAPQRPVRR